MGQAQSEDRSSDAAKPRSTMSHQPKKLHQPPKPPCDLLCCSSALPSSFTYLAYLAHLLPKETTHKTYQKPLSLGAILTPFLILLATTTSPLPARIPALFDPYILLIQVVRSTPLSISRHSDTETEIRQQVTEPRYFAILTPDEGEERLRKQKEGKEIVEGEVYVEVDRGEAERILRFPGSGQENFGDGETWTRAEGVEKIWCEECKVWWEFRAWVREL
jgi:hypothetical protein